MSRNGFTLVEVLVAITLSGIALGTAIGIFSSAQSAIVTLEAGSTELLRRGNGRTWMMEALASAYVDRDLAVSFHGEPNRIRFRTSQRVPQGWIEGQEVEIRMEDGALRGLPSEGAVLLLADSVIAASFDYLEGIGGDAPWRPRWQSDAVLPSAVRLRLTTAWGGRERVDTVLVLVGVPG